jgi:hypothetical protein
LILSATASPNGGISPPIYRGATPRIKRAVGSRDGQGHRRGSGSRRVFDSPTDRPLTAPDRRYRLLTYMMLVCIPPTRGAARDR